MSAVIQKSKKHEQGAGADTMVNRCDDTAHQTLNM